MTPVPSGPRDGSATSPAPSRRRRYILRALALILVVVLVPTGWSIGTALTRPGTDSVTARLAEWARDHGMSRLVTWAENQQYQHNKPKTGGTLSTNDRAALAAGAMPSPAIDLPAPISPVVSPALPGEGAWKVLASAKGRPVVLTSMLRPDTAHTSYLAYLAWMDGRNLSFSLHPGNQEPGHGPWGQPDSIPPGQRSGLVATFNGGFRLKDALAGPYGGWRADGRTVGALPAGYAAEIFRRDGSMTVGLWGRDATAADPTVVAVRENLRLLVDRGQVQTSVSDGSSRLWGYTIKNAYYVWRSGVGVTATGDVVFAAGPALSVRTLADLLQRAGAVRAMELDINPDWVSFMGYHPGGNPAGPTPVKLTGFTKPADRYYQPSTRDFVAAYAR